MKNSRKKIWIKILICLIAFSAIELPTGFFKAKAALLLAPPDSLVMTLKVFPEGYTSICADGNSPILLDITLNDLNHNPVPYSMIRVSTINFSGEVNPKYPFTDKNGRVIISIYPDGIIKPVDEPADMREIPVSVILNSKKSIPVKWDAKLSAPPVILIHGFQDSSESMIPLKNYLQENGFRVYTVDYDTNSDLETMAESLYKAICGQISDLKAEGVFAEKTDLVAHSLGGLVARYYTSRHSYIKNPNVNKIIFINVPHHGTPWAEAGAKILNSPFLEELHPTGKLYTSIFPNAINKGLNHNIQVVNIALENDEVIPLPSSMLNSWNIDTKIYRIGSEPLDLGSIILNPISGGSRHRQILFFTPVFEEILHFLTNNQPYPLKRK